ncbi:hypothetical protein Tco_1177701 [Tanacetum coccineum]
MNITADPQDLLALIQTQAQLIAMIQTHQALLDQVGYTGTNNVSASTSNVNMATLTLSAYHIGPTQPLVCYTSPSSFSQPTYGPKQFHQPHQIAAHALSNQSDFMTRRVLLRCDITEDIYSVRKPSPIPHAFLTSQYTWHQRLGHP